MQPFNRHTGIAVPLLKALNKALKFKFLESIELVPARGMFFVGAAGILGLCTALNTTSKATS